MYVQTYFIENKFRAHDYLTVIGDLTQRTPPQVAPRVVAGPSRLHGTRSPPTTSSPLIIRLDENDEAVIAKESQRQSSISTREPTGLGAEAERLITEITNLARNLEVNNWETQIVPEDHQETDEPPQPREEIVSIHRQDIMNPTPDNAKIVEADLEESVSIHRQDTTNPTPDNAEIVEADLGNNNFNLNNLLKEENIFDNNYLNNLNKEEKTKAE
ncbi:16577_t:CDS:2 [Dentiscutata erythropus]|uniref:16577_t:CDS:1 n=1 Tax=Dentiscutata erythropus TaxID=1348616 RepID=A0A9N9IQM7_9GLOM|nr:16577_t:CDS:2 [Dentiscutata erythropus]